MQKVQPICSVGFVAQTLTSTFPFLYVGILLTLATFFLGESRRTFREKVITPPSPPCNPRIGGGGMGEMLTILASSSGDDDIRFSFPDERASLSFFPFRPRSPRHGSVNVPQIRGGRGDREGALPLLIPAVNLLTLFLLPLKRGVFSVLASLMLMRRTPPPPRSSSSCVV